VADAVRRPAGSAAGRWLALGPVQRFLATESASGVILMAAAAGAFAWANSPWAGAYAALQHVEVGPGGLGLRLSLHDWVNDGLMALFFFLVGLEIKRELLAGELAGRERATLPIAAALGGMLVPAAVYAWLNLGQPSIVGWGVPMATDIAFAVGVLALLGPRVPLALKVLLLALAIVDDLGAVLVIAVFYTGALSLIALGLAAAAWLLALAYGRRGGGRAAAFLALGLPLWYLVHASGVHATVAGVLLALAVPLGARGEDGERAEGPLHRFEHALHPWVAFGVMPAFALFNAGVPVGGGGTALADPVVLGTFLGLLVGKPVGIVLFAAAAVAARLTRLPRGVGWAAVTGVGLLGGIGFTMALFIGTLAFGEGPVLNQAKIGVLLASVCAAVAGFVLLRATLPRPDAQALPRPPGPAGVEPGLEPR
jgi:NhaA family Na+:H+ antiporter